MTQKKLIDTNNLIKNVIFYREYLGRKMYLVFFLVAIAGLFEGLGLTLLIPFLERILGETITNSNGYLSEITIIIDKGIQFWVGFFGTSERLAISIVLLLVFFIKSVFVFNALLYSAHLRSKLGLSLRSKLIERIAKANIEVVGSNETSVYGNLLTEQINRVTQAFYFITQLFYNISTIIIYLIIISIISIKFLVFLLFGGLGFIIFFRSVNKFVRLLSVKKVQDIALLNKSVIELTSQLNYVKSTASEHEYVNPIVSLIKKIRLNDFKNGVASAVTMSTREIIALSFVIILILMKDYFFYGSTSHLLAASIIIYRTTSAIMNAQKLWQNTLEYVGSIEQYNDYCTVLHAGAEKDGRKETRGFKEIELKNVKYRYPSSGKYVIDNLNCKIYSGRAHAIIGPSGVGKSTIIDTITLNRTPSEGVIYIDGCESKKMNKSSWRSQIGFVSQFPSIRNCSVCEYVSMGEQVNNVDFHRINEALELVGLLKFFNGKRTGLSYELGENGGNLSGGQRQRLALAREIYKRPMLLILDEITSGLDAVSANQIKLAIQKIKSYTTLILITHNKEILSVADEVIDLTPAGLVERI